MPRRALASACLFLLASCAARRSAPVPDVGMPEYPPSLAPRGSASAESAAPALPKGIELEGTTWAGPDSDGTPWSFTYKPGGALHYSLAGSEQDSGTWKQHGSKVIMETNDHYADFTGTIEGNTITGSAHNRAGKAWTWVAERQR